MAAMKRELDKWQVVFSFPMDIARMDRGWRVAWIGIVKLHQFPNDGARISHRHYSGFLLNFCIWLPWGKA